jgi:hypothetical protein
VIPAAANHFEVAALGRVLSGTPFDITVTALDPYGNVDFNYAGTVTFSTSDIDPAVVLPLDYIFTPDDAGTHTFTDTGRGETSLITVGDQTITVSDGTIRLDIPVTVEQAGDGPGRSGRPGHGHGRSGRQPFAGLVNGPLKTAENGAALISGTSSIQFPNNPLMILPDLAADGRTNKKVTSPAHRALSIRDRFFSENGIDSLFPWEEIRV